MAPLCFMEEKITIYVDPDDAYPFLQNVSKKN
jgi:hypothetical protein